jgi:hypothetical protein
MAILLLQSTDSALDTLLLRKTDSNIHHTEDTTALLGTMIKKKFQMTL